MKKIILLLIFSASLLSCKKDILGRPCYTCIVGTETKEYCGDTQPRWTDSQGNDLQVYCKPK